MTCNTNVNCCKTSYNTNVNPGTSRFGDQSETPLITRLTSWGVTVGSFLPMLTFILTVFAHPQKTNVSRIGDNRAVERNEKVLEYVGKGFTGRSQQKNRFPTHCLFTATKKRAIARKNYLFRGNSERSGTRLKSK